jgi:dTDP-4-amino-4,6-dideoxygalactose transaminase
MAVPLFDTSSPLAPLREQLHTAVARVLDSGAYILGPEVSAFEQELAAYCGVAHAVGVANGTEAITIALRAMGVGPGDEVVVPSFTFYASAEAIPPTGATPVFCDIDPSTYCVTADTVRAALTPRTKAVIAVHLFGNIAPVAEIEALGVPVLEDAAQSAGSRMRVSGATTTGSRLNAGSATTTGKPSNAATARPGALGTAATFSFFPSKNLGGFGDGGAITTSDAGIAERARTLRFHGSFDKVTYDHVGYNSRLDELQAAILRVQLPLLDTWAAGRRAAGSHYEQSGIGELVALPVPVAGCEPAWHLYVIAHPHPEPLEAALAAASIGHKPYYRTPIHRQPAMLQWGAGVELPATEHAAATHLAIPMSAVLTQAQVEEVAAAVRQASAP